MQPLFCRSSSKSAPKELSERTQTKAGSDQNSQRKISPVPIPHNVRQLKDSSSGSKASLKATGDNADQDISQSQKSVGDAVSKISHRQQQQQLGPKKKKTRPLSPRYNRKRPLSPRPVDGRGHKDKTKNQTEHEVSAERSDLGDAQWDSSEELELFDSVEIHDQSDTPLAVASLANGTNSLTVTGPSSGLNTETSLSTGSYGGLYMRSTNAYYLQPAAQEHTWERTQSAQTLKQSGNTFADPIRKVQSVQTLKPVVEEEDGLNKVRFDLSSSSVWGSGSGILLGETEVNVESQIMSTSSLWNSNAISKDWTAAQSFQLGKNSSLASSEKVGTESLFPQTVVPTKVVDALNMPNTSLGSDIKNNSLVHKEESKQWSESIQTKSSDTPFPDSVWANKWGIFGSSDGFSLQPDTKATSVESSASQPQGTENLAKARIAWSHTDKNNRGKSLESAIQNTQSLQTLEEAMQDESKNPLQHQTMLGVELVNTTDTNHLEKFDGDISSLCNEFNSPFQTSQGKTTRISLAENIFDTNSLLVNGNVQSCDINSLTNDLLQSLATESNDEQSPSELLKDLLSTDDKLLATIHSSMKEFVSWKGLGDSGVLCDISDSSMAGHSLPVDQSNNSSFDDPAILTKIPVPMLSRSSSNATQTVNKKNSEYPFTSSNATVTPLCVSPNSETNVYTNGRTVNDIPTPVSSESAQFVFPSAYPSLDETALSKLVHNQDNCEKPGSDSVFDSSTLEEESENHSTSPPQSLTPVNDAASADDDQGITFCVRNEDKSESDPPSKFHESTTINPTTEQCSVTKENQEQSDLLFLIECFPYLEPIYLNKILQKCSGNVEDAVSIALVSATIPEKDLFSLTTTATAHCADDTSSSISSASDIVTASAELDVETEDGVMPIELEESPCANDEEIARALQEQMNSDTSGNEAAADKIEHANEVIHEDDNLELKLTDSLARQLQCLFGPVDKHLPFQGMFKVEFYF